MSEKIMCWNKLTESSRTAATTGNDTAFQQAEKFGKLRKKKQSDGIVKRKFHLRL